MIPGRRAGHHALRARLLSQRHWRYNTSEITVEHIFKIRSRPGEGYGGASRDTTNRDGGTLAFGTAAWGEFIGGVTSPTRGRRVP